MKPAEFIEYGWKQVNYFATEKQKHHWKSSAGEDLEYLEYDHREITENFSKSIENPTFLTKLNESQLLEKVDKVRDSVHFKIIGELLTTLSASEISVSEHYVVNLYKYQQVWGIRSLYQTEAEYKKEIDPATIARKKESEEFEKAIAKEEAERLEFNLQYRTEPEFGGIPIVQTPLEIPVQIVYEENFLNASMVMDNFVDAILPHLSIYGVSNHRVIASRKFGYLTEFRQEWIGEFEGHLNLGGVKKNENSPHLEVSINRQSNPYNSDTSEQKLDSFYLVHAESRAKLSISVQANYIDYGEKEIMVRFDGEEKILQKLKEELNKTITKY